MVVEASSLMEYISHVMIADNQLILQVVIILADKIATTTFAIVAEGNRELKMLCNKDL